MDVLQNRKVIGHHQSLPLQGEVQRQPPILLII